MYIYTPWLDRIYSHWYFVCTFFVGEDFSFQETIECDLLALLLAPLTLWDEYQLTLWDEGCCALLLCLTDYGISKFGYLLE